jgi:SAM-dependent methyltransferase
MKLLDIGSGPFPSALAFKDCEIYCLDPLIPGYVAAGFPIHYYERVQFVSAPSEEIPCPDHFFDAIISVNAIDHVDNFEKTTQEIRRVLAPGGILRFHVHYHTSTPLEPIELNDQIMMGAFAWCPGFHKLIESKAKRGHVLSAGGGMYSVWSNF